MNNNKYKKLMLLVIGILLVVLLSINTYLLITSFNLFILIMEIITSLALIILALEIVFEKVLTKNDSNLCEESDTSDNLEFLQIPSDMEEIPNSYHMNDLIVKEINMSDEVLKIGNSAFKYCSYLTKVKLSSSLTHIGLSAFSNCHSLKQIYIPKSVTYIGNWAFDKCPNLVIYCEAEEANPGFSEHWNPGNCPVFYNTSFSDYQKL